MKELTFKEVIANIKDGQVWESDLKIIKKVTGGIAIDHKEKNKSTPSMYFDNEGRFKLQRKEYTFEEAFKAYEEGKEIESLLGYKYKKMDGKDNWKSTINGNWSFNATGYDINEVRNKWYINE